MTVPRVPKGARVQLGAAIEKIVEVAKMMRQAGYPTTADELIRLSRMARVYTDRDGLFDALDRALPAPVLPPAEAAEQARLEASRAVWPQG
jgi:hypothetical protein